MIDFVRVGNKISSERKLTNLTQDELASKLFVSRQLVSKWENGTGIPSIDVLLELCNIFHITFEVLLCLDENTSIDNKDLFKGHERLFIIQGIINGEIKVDIISIFLELSPLERMMLLRQIKEGHLSCDMSVLDSKLTPSEKVFIRKEEKKL